MRTFVSVDVQPEYMGWADYHNYLPNFINYINENFDTYTHVIFLYNGWDTLGMITESGYIEWLLENGLREELIDRIKFYDKGYNFFRFPMDAGIDGEDIVEFIRFMKVNGVRDSREIDWEDCKGFAEDNETATLLKKYNDVVYLPDALDFLAVYDRIEVVGGGRNECLREIELGLMALNKVFTRNEEFCYG